MVGGGKGLGFSRAPLATTTGLAAECLKELEGTWPVTRLDGRMRRTWWARRARVEAKGSVRRGDGGMSARLRAEAATCRPG